MIGHTSRASVGNIADALSNLTQPYAHPDLRSFDAFEHIVVEFTHAGKSVTASASISPGAFTLFIWLYLLQALAVCGGGMLIFQLLVYPRIVTRISPTRSQRCACLVAIPVFFAYPFLSQLHDSGSVRMAASLVLLFFTNASANTVGNTPASIHLLSPSRCRAS